MAWNYSGDPSTSDLDWVRFRIGDTLEEDPQLTDEEILALIAQYGSDIKAAYQACKRILALYARRVDKSVGGSNSESLSQRQAHYKALCDEIDLEIAETADAGGGVRITGASVARRTTVREDPDRVHPPARRGQWSRTDDSDISGQ